MGDIYTQQNNSYIVCVNFVDLAYRDYICLKVVYLRAPDLSSCQ